jgi:hypothetical protein
MFSMPTRPGDDGPSLPAEGPNDDNPSVVQEVADQWSVDDCPRHHPFGKLSHRRNSHVMRSFSRREKMILAMETINLLYHPTTSQSRDQSIGFLSGHRILVKHYTNAPAGFQAFCRGHYARVWVHCTEFKVAQIRTSW